MTPFFTTLNNSHQRQFIDVFLLLQLCNHLCSLQKLSKMIATIRIDCQWLRDNANEFARWQHHAVGCAAKSAVSCTTCFLLSQLSFSIQNIWLIRSNCLSIFLHRFEFISELCNELNHGDIRGRHELWDYIEDMKRNSLSQTDEQSWGKWKRKINRHLDNQSSPGRRLLNQCLGVCLCI